MFSRVSAFPSLVVTIILWLFTPLLAGLVMVSAVFVSSILYAADAISALLVYLITKLNSRVAARLPSVVRARAVVDGWVPAFVVPLKTVFNPPFRYHHTYLVIDAFLFLLAVLPGLPVDTETLECLRTVLLAYLPITAITYILATRRIRPGAEFLPTALGMVFILVPAWVILALGARWIRRHPANEISTHLLLLVVGLIIYNHEIRVICSPSSKPCTTPDTPPVPDPPVLPKPVRGRYRNVLVKQGPKYRPTKYVAAPGPKRQTPEPNQIPDHDNHPTSMSLVVRPKTYVLPRPKDLSQSIQIRATDVDQQRQLPATGLCIQASTYRLRIEAPPPVSTIDPSDEESAPAFARLMETAAHRNNWPRPAAPKYELGVASSHTHSKRACVKGEEIWRKWKWYLPEPIVPDRDRAPYGFCSQRRETEWSGVRERERAPYGYRPGSGFTHVAYAVASDEIVVVGIRERTRTPYSLIAREGWACVLRLKLPLALPAPQQDVAEEGAETPMPIETPSDPTNVSESDSDDNSSDPLTPSDPVPTVPNEPLDYPLPAAPVIGKRAREWDLLGSPSKRQRGESAEPQGETGSTCATEVPTTDDSTSSTISTPDSSFNISSPQCFTPLKRAHDDSSLDTPSKRHCGEKKSDCDTDATWAHQEALEDNPANPEDHAPLPTGIHPVDEDNHSDATLFEDLPTQQPGPDNLLAAPAAAVGSSNPTASAAVAPLSGPSADSFAPSSSSNNRLPSRRRVMNSTLVRTWMHHSLSASRPRRVHSGFPGYTRVPRTQPAPVAELDAFIGHLPAPATAHPTGAQIGGPGNTFSGLGPASFGLPQLDVEPGMLIDQTADEILQGEFGPHAGEMMVDEAGELMAAWLNPDAFAMDHAPEHPSGEPIEIDSEILSAPSQEGSPTPMAISSPVLDAAHELPGSPIGVDHPAQDEPHFSPADTPLLFAAHPVPNSPDTAMAPATPQPVTPPAAWVAAAMAQPLPQSPQDTPEAEDEVTTTAEVEAAGASHNEPGPSMPANPPATTSPVSGNLVNGHVAASGRAFNNRARGLVRREIEDVMATPPGSPTPNGQSTRAPQPQRSSQLRGWMRSTPAMHPRVARLRQTNFLLGRRPS